MRTLTESVEQQTLLAYAHRHSYCDCSDLDGITISDEAYHAAVEWRNGHTPEFVELIEDVGDGNNHDISRIRYYRTDGYAIYSYNNNAWGHCDVLPADTDPGSIEDWLRLWDIDNMERWMAELVGREEEWEDANGF